MSVILATLTFARVSAPAGFAIRAMPCLSRSLIMSQTQVCGAVKTGRGVAELALDFFLARYEQNMVLMTP